MPCRGYANMCHASLPGMGLKPSYLEAARFQPFPGPQHDAQSSPGPAQVSVLQGMLWARHVPRITTYSVLTDLANGTRGQSCLPSAYLRQGKKIHDFQAASEFSTILSNIKSLLICKSHPTYFYLEVTSTGINKPTESLHFLTLMVFTKTGRPPGMGQPLPTQQQHCQPGPAPAPCNPVCTGQYK